MGYGDAILPQRRREPQPNEQYDDGPEPQPQPGSEFVYPNDPYKQQRDNSDTALQVRKVIWEAVPSYVNADGAEDWIDKFTRTCEYASRIPGIDSLEFESLCRDMEDFADRAHSQGRARIVSSKLQKFQFRLRLLVSRCDVPAAGISGIGAMITSKNEMKQDIRLPPPAAPQSRFWPWGSGKK